MNRTNREARAEREQNEKIEAWSEKTKRDRAERKDEDKRQNARSENSEANKHCPQQGDQELSDKVTRCHENWMTRNQEPSSWRSNQRETVVES